MVQAQLAPALLLLKSHSRRAQSWHQDAVGELVPGHGADRLAVGKPHYYGSQYSPCVARPPEVIAEGVGVSTSRIIDEPLHRENDHRGQPGCQQQHWCRRMANWECAIRVEVLPHPADAKSRLWRGTFPPAHKVLKYSREIVDQVVRTSWNAGIVSLPFGSHLPHRSLRVPNPPAVRRKDGPTLIHPSGCYGGRARSLNNGRSPSIDAGVVSGAVANRG